MKEKLIKLIEQAKYCSPEELADYLMAAGLVLLDDSVKLHRINIDQNGAPEVTIQIGARTLVLHTGPVNVREVIFCKECKSFESIHIRPFLGCCSTFETVVNENGFCHHGERRTDEKA